MWPIRIRPISVEKPNIWKSSSTTFLLLPWQQPVCCLEEFHTWTCSTFSLVEHWWTGLGGVSWVSAVTCRLIWDHHIFNATVGANQITWWCFIRTLIRSTNMFHIVCLQRLRIWPCFISPHKQVLLWTNTVVSIRVLHPAGPEQAAFKRIIDFHTFSFHKKICFFWVSTNCQSDRMLFCN